MYESLGLRVCLRGAAKERRGEKEGEKDEKREGR